MLQDSLIEKNITPNLLVRFTANRKALGEALECSLGALSTRFRQSEKVIAHISDSKSWSGDGTSIDLFLGDAWNQQGKLSFVKNFQGTVSMPPPRLEPALEHSGIMTVLLAETIVFTNAREIIVQGAGPKVQGYLAKLRDRRQFFSSTETINSRFDGDDMRGDVRCVPQLAIIRAYIAELTKSDTSHL